MTRWHALWFVASFALAFGINMQMRPALAFDLTSADLSHDTGTLVLSDAGREHRLGVATLQVLTKDVDRLFGGPIHVRELLLQTPVSQDSELPDVELFIDFSAPGAEIAADARDVTLLRERELSVIARPIGREVHSRVRFPGEAEAEEVSGGTLSITDALELDGGDGIATWRIRGELQLTVGEDEGARTVEGDLTARLRWE